MSPGFSTVSLSAGTNEELPVAAGHVERTTVARRLPRGSVAPDMPLTALRTLRPNMSEHI